MPIIVCKFGGSSVASAAQFEAVLDLIRASPHRRCVVLSAPGVGGNHGEKVTGLLERCWQGREDPARFEPALRRVTERFGDLAAALGVSGFAQEARGEILRAASVSRDEVLSRGEYLCAVLFSRWSGIPAADAASLVFFDRAGDVDEAATACAFRQLAQSLPRAVVPGFYGTAADGGIRTFPRNGSDITGALAAAGMGADLYENWTDVPGLMTADPDLVPQARLIDQVSYRQMRALARDGAQVLHPACLDPVALAGIPTRLRSMKRPDCFGTLIDDRCAAIVPCVTGRPEAQLPRVCGISGESAACVSVFGVPEPHVRDAARTLEPICIEPTAICTRVYLKPDCFEEAVQYLHRVLI